MAKVKIPTPLLRFTGNKAFVEVSGGTVADVIEGLEKACPGIRERLLKGGEMNRFINVYVDGEDIRFAKGLKTSVGAASEVSLVPAISGG